MGERHAVDDKRRITWLGFLLDTRVLQGVDLSAEHKNSAFALRVLWCASRVFVFGGDYDSPGYAAQFSGENSRNGRSGFVRPSFYRVCRASTPTAAPFSKCPYEPERTCRIEQLSVGRSFASCR